MSFFETETPTRPPEKPESATAPETPEQPVPYEVGDIIKLNITADPDEDPENYYYLAEFKGKRGMIKEVIKQKRLQYRALFGDKMVYLYHDEII